LAGVLFGHQKNDNNLATSLGGTSFVLYRKSTTTYLGSAFGSNFIKVLYSSSGPHAYSITI